ncbi:peptide/nickel transport system ATP-binding protein [Paenochrobactrum gallinarii]|uniref:Peptide/nickel transport system ATP-binding protein n=1 Tax=Paenochrobactrum gallinarii TaxID=643673 RepID=A0A841LR09_9HYPH|nr:ATP-binding cassette domain-containing protein [Paenochrobactrum gallinarii]MBB6260503.1 peptide/nickel transport system ATP-binding protein [Paenochrobactrum gallinarii]
MTDQVILQAEGLKFGFPGTNKLILNDVSLSISRGETLALVGRSGSGKSTLARILLRLIKPQRGQISFNGADWLALQGKHLRQMRAKMQMVFQDPLAAFNPNSTICTLLDEPLRIHGMREVHQRAIMITQLLYRVALDPALITRRVDEVSGGQRQRIAIARALATKPELIVLDEAVASLDVSVRAHILDLLQDIQARDQTSYLFITHDLAVAKRIAHKIAVMDEGKIVEYGRADDILDDPQTAITKALIAASPRLKR